ncbi:DUF4296 domain-containing protein [Prevotella sp. TCVGH]|uniref:DUF4296 domain-containing protein n=1 Tax=Prevotellaceae TaxID=171552 RepID=UPI0018976401|nr:MULTISPECIES: DUF4296 domain-containing protein [Prevotellaceae]MCL6748294.1 DUF4296 domain-containing protein [Prevotella sp. TCVGH]
MSKKLLTYCLCSIFYLLTLISCKPSVPKQYIQEDKMEDILYDYHLADAMYRGNYEDASLMLKYKAAVLKKHGVSEAEFDSSMVYYTRHTRLLQHIYESLSNRMSKDALSLGASASQVNRYQLNSASGDTANIWRDNRSMVLSPYRPFNVSSYTIQADSTFKPGDRLFLNFDAQFIYQDGTRDAVAIMAVKFKNDSVATQTLYVSTPNHYTTQISDDNNIGIKEIRGYFLLNNNNPADAYSTTFKLMILTNISLVKIHVQKKKTKQQSDSLNVDSTLMHDSLRAAPNRGMQPKRREVDASRPVQSVSQ